MIGAGRGPRAARDWTTTWLVLLTAAAMGYLAGLGLAAGSAADGLARRWTNELDSRATVSLTPISDTPAEQAQAVERALATIRATPGVLSARALDRAETDALIAQALGEAGMEEGALEDLRAPTLIDVTFAPERPPDFDDMAARMDAAGLSAVVDAHGAWAARLHPAAQRLRGFAYAATAMLAAISGLTVALVCVAGLTAQAQMVDLLRLVGATDGFVATIFVRRVQLLVFAGSALGVALAAVTLVSWGGGGPEASDAELAPLAQALRPEPSLWPSLALTPLAFALIATVSGWTTVMLALRRRSL